MKRVILFLVTNIAVLATLSIAMSVIFSIFGIDTRSMGGLLIFAAIFGFGGAFISLLMSKWMAKKSTGAVVIERASNATEQWLLDTVSIHAKKAGIGVPEVAIFNSPEMNAFATGAKKDQALVAVSSGLLNNMSQDEAEAVIGHEISHIANGDMVTLTLIQGVVNTFVIFLARVVAGIIDNATRGDDEESGMGGIGYFVTVFILEMLFGILASMVVAWFSRQREYRADAGGATLAGKQSMIAALERLKQSQESRLEGSMMAFGINSQSKLMSLMASHPPLDERIKALKQSF